MRIEMVELYDIYGSLLNERQREVADLYYNEDYSLAEISENVGITRQGVRDCIVKLENQLLFYERVLLLKEKREKTKESLVQLSEMIDSLQAKSLLNEIIENLD